MSENAPSIQIENQRKWSRLVERAGKDAELKQRLLNDPAPVLQAEGIEVPAGASVLVTEENGRLSCVMEVAKAAAAAAAGELSASDLASVAGGAPTGTGTVEYLKLKLTEVLITSVN
jgi:hypothetical protein